MFETVSKVSIFTKKYSNLSHKLFLLNLFTKIFPKIQETMVKALYDSYNRYQELKNQEEKSK